MVRSAFFLIAGLSVSVAVGAEPVIAPLLIDDFEDIQNSLGGYRNPFQRAPSQAQAARIVDGFHGGQGRSVRITGHRAATGYCGYWLHFFDFKSLEKKYLDTRPYRFLSFWVKGERSGEDFLVKLADRHWIEKEDSLAIGTAAEFLVGGVTTRWREVLIPLDRLPQLDRREMAGLTIEFESPGDHVVFLDHVCLKGEAGAAVPPSLNDDIVLPPARSVARKLWAWNSAAVLLDRQAGDQLLDFCTKQGIDEIWMQLLYSLDAGANNEENEEAASPAITIRYEAEWRDFLRRSHARGVRIEALDGAAHYSQRAHHQIPLAVVDGVIAFNQGGAPADQFDGVHFDNEPYLLVGWIDPQLREEILREFLELNAECQRRIRSTSNMTFGIDIPFWWQERDPQTGRPIGDVEFRGKRQAASYHCLEMLDRVGVMNYRDTADGADGMIAHGRGLLAFAERPECAKVLMGAETFQGPPTPVYFALGLPRQAFFDTLRESAKSLARTGTLLGFRLQTLDDGENIHVGIEVPSDISRARKQDARRALVELAQRTGIRRDAAGDSTNAWHRAAEFVDATAEWSGFSVCQITDERLDSEPGRLPYPGFRVVRTMLPKITFADDPPGQFAAEVAAAEAYFGRYKSFGGMAVHYYETVRKLTGD